VSFTEEQSTCRTINIIHPDIKGIIESKLRSQHPKFPNFFCPQLNHVHNERNSRLFEEYETLTTTQKNLHQMKKSTTKPTAPIGPY